MFESKNATAIHYRAAERSLQILSKNLMGKLKKILQYFGSPVIPNSAGDALDLLVNVQAVSEEKSRFFRKIIGFRNAIVHHYMELERKIVSTIVVNRDYDELVTYLLETPEYSDTLIKRIENITL